MNISKKVLVYTIYDEAFKPIKDIVHENNKNKFEAIGVDYQAFEYTQISKTFWEKWDKCTELLEEGTYDVIMFIDCDIAVLNAYNPAMFLEFTDKDVLFCSVFESTDPTSYWNINAGSCIIRNTELSINCMKALTVGSKYAIDQVFIQSVLRNGHPTFDFRKIIEIFPPRVFNSTGSFVTHKCGASTTNTPLQQAIEHKIKTLKETIGIHNE